MIFFFFFVVQAAGPQKWPSKNHAISLMAVHHSRHYKLGSGCHPFGIVIVDPSANFTFLNPGAGSSIGVDGVPPGCLSGTAVAAVANWYQQSCPLQVLDSERLPGSYWHLDFPSTLAAGGAGAGGGVGACC